MADGRSRPWVCTRSPAGHHEIARYGTVVDHCKWCGVVARPAVMDGPITVNGVGEAPALVGWRRWNAEGEPLPRPRKRSKSGPSQNTREWVHRRDDWLCRYCGKEVRRTARRLFVFRATLDHVIPRSRGGSNDRENLVTCCQPCNDLKADRTPEEAGMPLLPVGTFRIAYIALSPE